MAFSCVLKEKVYVPGLIVFIFQVAIYYQSLKGYNSEQLFAVKQSGEKTAGHNQ